MNTITLPTQTRRLRRGAAVLLAGLLAGTLAGCGGNAEAEKPTARIPADVEKAYHKCMTKAGYPQVEKGTLGKPGKDPLWKDKDFVAAQEKCQESSGLNSFGPGHEEEKVDQDKEDKKTLAMTKCLRDKGWKLRDPARHEDGLQLDIPEFDDEEKQRAFGNDFRACAKKVGVEVVDAEGDDSGSDGHGDDGHDDHEH